MISFAPGVRMRPGVRGSGRGLMVAGLMGLVMTMAACGYGRTGDGSTTTAHGGAITHPSGTADLVLRAQTGGGLVPMEVRLSELPEFSLYGDGRAITEGPMIEIYPQPAMPNLQQATLTEAGIQTLLSGAREAGLFETFDYGTPGITDVGTTVFTVDANGERVVNRIYALGFDAPLSRLTDAQKAARKKVVALSNALFDLTGTLGDDVGPSTPYAYTALAVYARVAGPDDLGGAGGVAPNHLEWPLADLASATPDETGFGRVVVKAQDAETLRPLLDQATQITVWESAGKPYRLVFRPLLPDEPVS